MNLKNPSKFWKTINSLSENNKGFELPPCIVKGSQKISDKPEILACFNEHFISCGFLFESLNPSLTPTNFNSINDSQDQSGNSFTPFNSFAFSSILVSGVHSILKTLDITKSAGPDTLEPFFLKLAADFIALPLTHIFNLTLVTNNIPKIWKSAYVLPLLKRGAPVF